MLQTEMVMNHLEEFGSITPMEAIETYGITRLSATIFDLKKLGVPIETKMETGINRFGKTTRFARYTINGNS